MSDKGNTDDAGLEGKLSSWLEEQGYPLEMEVALAFRAKGFRTGQGAYYSDPDTNEPREIDVVASQGKNIGDVAVWLTCFVECKASRDKPWVLFTSLRSEADANFDYYSMIASQLGMHILSRLYRKTYVPLPRAITPPPRIGYGLAQSERTKQQKVDISYGAVMSAAKAAVARATAIDTETLSDPLHVPVVEVIVPVVVIDAPLFEYFITDILAEKELRRIQSGVLNWGNPISGRNKSTLVHIVTKEGLPDFVSDMAYLVDHLYETSTKNLERLLENWSIILNRRGIASP